MSEGAPGRGGGAPFLSVVVPIYDEEACVEPLHRELALALDKIPGEAEIILVDDGSRDGSLARMRELSRRDPRVRVLALDRNHGQTAALDAGFRAARGELVATLDGDLQNDPADLPRLIALLDGADVVSGIRARREDGLVRRVSSRIGNGFRNWVTRESVTDVGCSIRVMRRVYLERVKLFRGMHRFLPTLLRMEGARLAEIPVGHRPRTHGRSKYGIANRLFVGLADVFAVRWMQSRALRYRAEELAPAGAPADQPPARTTR